MNSIKKMLLGFAFLLIALMGAILYSDFGYVLFIVCAPIGLLFCIFGCYDEKIKAWFKGETNQEQK